MIFEKERPIVAAVHPKLIEELKHRQISMEEATGRKTRGGMTTFSEQAGYELESIRTSGQRIMSEIFKLKEVPIKKFIINGIELDFVPYEYYKKLYIFSSVLHKKKDQKQIKVEVQKIKGLQKDEVKIFW
jgi:hypothetical protein